MCFSEERVKHSDIDKVEAATGHTTYSSTLLHSSYYEFILPENGPIFYEPYSYYTTPDYRAVPYANTCGEPLSTWFSSSKKYMQIWTKEEIELEQIIVIVNSAMNPTYYIDDKLNDVKTGNDDGIEYVKIWNKTGDGH